MIKRPARQNGKTRKQALGETLEHVRRDRAHVVYREARTKRPYAILVAVDDEETVEAIEELVATRVAAQRRAEARRQSDRMRLDGRKVVGFK